MATISAVPARPGMSDKQRAFLEGPIGKTLFLLAVPMIAANLLQTGYQLTDAFWVGRLGADAVAAVAVSFPLTFLVIALGSGLAMAGATLAAQYAGAGKQEMVNHVAAQTMLMVAIVSVVLGAFGYGVAPLLLHGLHVSLAVYAGALGFMRWSFVGVPFVFVYIMFGALMRGVGHVKSPLMITLGTVLLNFALDPIFIFGWGPIAPHGVMGAAMATFATQALAAVIGVAIFLRGRQGIQLHWTEFKPDPPYICSAFKLGLPGSIEMSTRALGLMVMTFLVSGFGTLVLATYGVGSSVLQIVFVPAMGLAMAASTLVGQNMGAGKVDRAGKIAVMATAYAFVMLTIAGGVSYFLAPHIIAFFVPNDARVIAGGAHYLRIMCWAWGGIGIQLCISSAFRACGKMVDAMVIAMVGQWLVQFPVSYMLSRHTPLGSEGLWWGFPITNTLVALIACGWFARGTWKTGRLTDGVRTRAMVAQEVVGEESFVKDEEPSRS